MVMMVVRTYETIWRFGVTPIVPAAKNTTATFTASGEELRDALGDGWPATFGGDVRWVGRAVVLSFKGGVGPDDHVTATAAKVWGW